MSDSFRLLTFETSDVMVPDELDNTVSHKLFNVKMFGVNEQGKTACIMVKDYSPFFYVKVGDEWTENLKLQFIEQIAMILDEPYASAIVSSKLIKQKKLYGFDGGKQYNFVQINFSNEAAMKKTKGLWYSKENPEGEYRLNPDGYVFAKTKTILYEAQIPPLLRLFHIKEISPSGWVELPENKTKYIKNKTTTCDYELSISYTDIIPLPNKETIVPFKICSFDIEASSSHGDFPLPVKNYKKLATNIVDVCNEKNEYTKELIKAIIMSAFGYNTNTSDQDKPKYQQLGVDMVYPIKLAKKTH